MPHILIAIPAKNEAASLKLLLDDIQKVVGALPHKTTICVFDDNSSDNTAVIADTCGATVYSIHESRGLGYVFTHIATYALKNNYTYVVTIDADRQFDPHDIPQLLQPLFENKADFTTGSRFLPTSKVFNISHVKRLGNNLGAQVVSSILKKRFRDVTCGFRAYTRNALLKVHTYSDFTYTQEVFLNLGIKKLTIQEVPITVTYFKDRKSKMVRSVFSYIFKSFKIIFKFMILYAPMKLFSFLGNLSFLLALAAGIFVIIYDTVHGTLTPFKWIGVTGTSLGIAGVVFYCTGLLLQITSRIQLTQEDALYYLKKKEYGE